MTGPRSNLTGPLADLREAVREEGALSVASDIVVLAQLAFIMFTVEGMRYVAAKALGYDYRSPTQRTIEGAEKR